MTENVVVVQLVLAGLRLHPARDVSRAELMVISGATERQVRCAVSELRREGFLIVGDSGQYHMARNVEEVNQCVADLTRHIQTLDDVRAAMTASARVEFGETDGNPVR